MEDKIPCFQLESVSAEPTRPSFNDGSDQDEPETQHNRLSSQEWSNCQNCEKMPTRLQYVCCHEIPEVKACHFKGKARLSWNTAALEFREAVVRLKACNFMKQRLRQGCFPVNIAKFLRTAFFIEQFWWVLLNFLQNLLNITVKKIISQ